MKFFLLILKMANLSSSLITEKQITDTKHYQVPITKIKFLYGMVHSYFQHQKIIVIKSNRRKFMKKQIFFLSIMVSFAHTLYGMSSNEIIRTMISTHTRAFDKRNTYDDRLDNEHINNFNTVINEAEKFVVNNSDTHKKQL